MLKRSLIAIFVAWLIVVAPIAPFRVNAQSVAPIAAFQSSTTFVNYDAGSGVYPFGDNAQMTIYPGGGVLFPATSSGACGFPYPQECRGVRVFFGFNGAPCFGNALLTYVSPHQINLITLSPCNPGAVESWTVYVQKGAFGPTTHQGNISIYPRTAFPIVSYQIVQGQVRPLATGSLYSSTGQFIKGLADGAANPRIFNGQPTIAQIYFTGYVAPGSDTLAINYNGAFLRNAPFISVESPGVALTNVESPSGGWSAGVFPITFSYTAPSPAQVTTFNAYIWWAN